MNIRRSEIWLVNLDPTLGAEIRKTRPVIVISSDVIGVLPIKLVAPLTEWKEYLNQNIWRIDAVVELAQAVYIFEFKIGRSAARALAQIKENRYYEKYRLSGKAIHLVGVKFSLSKRGGLTWVDNRA